MTRTIQTELERTGLVDESPKRPRRFISHAIEAMYVSDMAEMDKTKLKYCPKYKQQYRIRKGGPVRMIKVKQEKGVQVIDKNTIGYRMMSLLYATLIPLSGKEIKGIHSDVNPKTVSAYLTWFSQAGLVEKTKEGPKNIKWALVPELREKPLEVVYADYMNFIADTRRTSRKSEEVQPKTKFKRREKKEPEPVKEAVKAHFPEAIFFEEEEVASPLKELVSAFKKLLTEGMTINIKISIE
jgi:hypothetical protein